MDNMNNESYRHYNEAGIADDCSDSERVSLPDEHLLNLRVSRHNDGKLRENSPNSGKHTTCRKYTENYTFGKEKTREEYTKIHSKKNGPEGHSYHREDSPARTKTKSPQRNKLSQRERQAPGFSELHSSDKKKQSEPYRGPSLIDRRMEFLFSEQGNTEGEDSQKVQDFPFRQTPSGHFKIYPDQVVFSSKKVSVLVADPTRTKVNIQKELEKSKLKGFSMPPIPDKLFQHPQNAKVDSFDIPKMRSADLNPEFEEMIGDGPDCLKPEMKLDRLGYYNNVPIDYSKLSLPLKTNLYHELYRRISNYVNTDVKVVIGQEEFSCHSMVLQAYSEYFEKEIGIHRIELPSKEVSVNAFVVIYDWMITGKDCVTLLRRENILELFVASRFLIIKELEEQCWAFLDSDEVFSEDTAFMLYTEARKLQLNAIKELMIPRIRNFFLMLVSSQDFIELDTDEVCLLLRSNYVAVNCEMEVLMSAVRWLKADWENRIQHLYKIMSCIRFGLIAPWQLVDIKRNPENPELLEMMNVPEITKMVDDGLSFVIIKYWYGHQSDDYTHWIELLGLKEPQERNWAGSEKNYVTYRQFLAFLDAYRRDNLLEKNKMKTKKVTEIRSAQACYPPADLLTPTGSTDKGLTQSPQFSRSPKRYAMSSTDGSRTPTTVTRSPSEDEAAAMIQTAYRNYKRRKETTHEPAPKQRSPKTFVRMQNKPKSPTKIVSQNFKVLSMFASHKDPHENNMHQKKMGASAQYASNHKFLVKGSLFSNDRESVLVFGGLDPHTSFGVGKNTGKDIYRYLPETNCWDYVGELPEPRQHHSTAFFRGRVYLAGGANPLAVSEDTKDKGLVVNTVWSFDPITRTWYRENSMITARKNFGLVVSHMKLYAIGGQDRNSRMLSSVERFEAGGKWEEVAPLKTPRMGMACTKYRDCIWVAGGMCGSKRNPLVNIVECYDTRKNEWTRIENLRFPRCFACLFAMNDRLYLIGGAGRISEKDKNTNSVAAIDVWDPRDREWKLKTELAIPRHGHSVSYLGTQILVIGGVTTVYMRALGNTECYCCERYTWVRGIAPLPTTLSGHSSVTLPPASLL